MCQMTYKGPDSGNKWMVVPQAKLGSNPLRLSKLSKEQNKEASNENVLEKTDVQPGSSVWDEQNRVAIMPRGSCDLNCRRGKRKTTAIPFHFFCSKPADVSFKATVSKDAERAFLWLNDQSSTLWDLAEPKSSSLLVNRASELDSTDIHVEVREQDTAKALEVDAVDPQVALLQALGISSMDLMSGSMNSTEGQDIGLKEAAVSPAFAVGAGEHVLRFQGRPRTNQAFALKDLRFAQGGHDCKFFLEGKDKHKEDCH